MNKKETIADILWDDSPPKKASADFSYSLDFSHIKEIRIGNFVYQNPNISVTRTSNEEYTTGTRNSFRPTFRN